MTAQPKNTTAVSTQVSAEDAQVAATDFLLDHVGNQLVASAPHLMVSAWRAVWIVTIELAYIHTGTIGSVGVVAVDAETGQVIAWTPIEQIKAASRKLRESHEPVITEQFRAFMTPDIVTPES